MTKSLKMHSNNDSRELYKKSGKKLKGNLIKKYVIPYVYVLFAVFLHFCVLNY